MFERFSELARQATIEAQGAARAWGHGQISCDHMLVGLLRTEGSNAQLSLVEAGFELESLEVAVEQRFPQEPVGEQIPFTAPLKKAFELALREALSLGHGFIGTGHIALGLSRLGLQTRDAENSIAQGDASVLRDAVIGRLARGEDPEQPRNQRPQRAERAVDDDAALEAATRDLQDAVQTYADRPAAQDSLGRQALAEILAERMRFARGEGASTQDRDSSGAILIHLHAPWGAGKSSLLRLLRRDLEEPRDRDAPKWAVVEFNAWQHQRVSPPWWWLLAAVRRDGLHALRSRSRWRASWFRVRDLAWRLWNARDALVLAAIATALLALLWATDLFGLDDTSLQGVKAAATTISAVIVLLAGGAALVRGVGLWLVFGSSPPATRLLQRVHDPLRAAQERFRFLLRSIGDPVAIFIEDLDRCRGEYVVELLEGIQTLFIDDAVTFVVAADRRWLCESYRTSYTSFADMPADPGRPLGYLFLEKTFQISLEIPPLGDSTRRHYWSRLVRSSDDVLPTVGHGEADRAASEFVAGLRTEAELEEALGAPADSPQQLEARRRAAVRLLASPALQRDLEHVLEPFAHLLERNPRGLKRLVNAYGVERSLQIRNGLALTARQRMQSVLWIIVRLRWPVLGEYMIANPACVASFHDSERAAEDVPRSLRPLFGDEEVRQVIMGGGLGVVLDQAAVRTFLGVGEPASTVGA